VIRYVSAKGLLDPAKGYSLEYNLSGTADILFVSKLFKALGRFLFH